MITPEEFPSATTALASVDFHDDMIVGSTTRRVVDELNANFSRGRLEAAARDNERQRLARELHDGVLQSLTGAVLRLRALSNTTEAWPDSVRARLQELETLIVEQQRDLREWIDTLKPPSPTAMASHTDMETALRTLCESVSNCGIRVQLRVPLIGSIPRRVGDQIYRLVQESLSNAARHAEAKNVHVDLLLLPHRIRLVIADDGCGFPFQGTLDLPTLNARGLGPVSIKERVVALKGELTLVSAATGSRLTIELPRMRPLPGLAVRTPTV